MPKSRSIHEVAFRLSYDMGVQIRPRMVDSDVSLAPQQLRTMRRVWTTGQATLADICATLKRDKGQVTRIVDELCELDLLVRTPNPNDGRSKLVELTRRGTKVFETIERIEEEFSSELIEGISKEDLAAFFRVSDRLSENMRRMNE